jgi:hypothetical protein
VLTSRLHAAPDAASAASNLAQSGGGALNKHSGGGCLVVERGAR